jgi:hypothetical protein
MPSPFPGMDPYVEDTWWTTVHFSLSAEFVRLLAPKLRPRYLVLPAERFVMETPESVAITAAGQSGSMQSSCPAHPGIAYGAADAD